MLCVTGMPRLFVTHSKNKLTIVKNSSYFIILGISSNFLSFYINIKYVFCNNIITLL